MSLVQCPTPAGSSDAGHLLDGMPDSVAAGGEDRIGALPGDILRLVLSFLPSRESVCTCVLARRWRNLWKSVPTVLIYDEEDARFVTSLLLLRDRVPLHEFEFTSFLSETPQDVEMWLWYAASCHVRVLRLDVESYCASAATQHDSGLPALDKLIYQQCQTRGPHSGFLELPGTGEITDG
ncbi:hypothetical protein ACQ4PT_036208 [Festuca glaucescens]